MIVALHGATQGTTGTEGNDVLAGNQGSDQIAGKEGDDLIFGLGGDDTLYGDAAPPLPTAPDATPTGGNDLIIGDAGNDSIWGGLGSDTVLGGDGDDTIYGDVNPSLGRWQIDAQDDADWLSGGAGDDMLADDYGVDLLWGGAGADTFVFGTKRDDFTPFTNLDTRVGEGNRDIIADFTQDETSSISRPPPSSWRAWASPMSSSAPMNSPAARAASFATKSRATARSCRLTGSPSAARSTRTAWWAQAPHLGQESFGLRLHCLHQ